MVFGATVLGVGCVVPTPLPPEGGDNRAPVILIEQTDPYSDPNLDIDFTWEQDADPKEITLRVRDPDEQTLFFRAFLDRDYSQRIPIDGDRSPPTGSSDGERLHLIKIKGLCDEVVNFLLGDFALEVYVSDNGFEGAGREPAPGGLRDNIGWRFSCVEPLPQGDGGP